MRSITVLALLFLTQSCCGQEPAASEADLASLSETVGVEKTFGQDNSAAVSNSPAADVDADDGTDRLSKAVEGLSAGLKLTFILLMFTNAVLCGRWALETDRNFWGWYLFALFTGPLAGGSMLHRVATDKAGGSPPSGCLAAILGFGIPLAGWVIWLALLS